MSYPSESHISFFIENFILEVFLKESVLKVSEHSLENTEYYQNVLNLRIFSLEFSEFFKTYTPEQLFLLFSSYV